MEHKWRHPILGRWPCPIVGERPISWKSAIERSKGSRLMEVFPRKIWNFELNDIKIYCIFDRFWQLSQIYMSSNLHSHDFSFHSLSQSQLKSTNFGKLLGGLSGGFRGCSWGQLPPFMMKTRLGAPFSVRRAPLILTQMHSFFVFRSESGKHMN